MNINSKGLHKKIYTENDRQGLEVHLSQEQVDQLFSNIRSNRSLTKRLKEFSISSKERPSEVHNSNDIMEEVRTELEKFTEYPNTFVWDVIDRYVSNHEGAI